MITDQMVENAWVAIVGSAAAPLCFQASIIRADLKIALTAALRDAGWRDISALFPTEGLQVLLGYLDKSGKFAARSARYRADIWDGARKRICPGWVCTMDGHLIDDRATHFMPYEAPLVIPYNGGGE